MSSRPRILITNDDGIDAPGIRWLARATARQGFDVVVAAPLTEALIKLHEDGAEAALLSRADAGALALFNEEIYRVGIPKLTIADHRGAGDSMTAGVAAVLAKGGEMTQAVRTGAAAGALNVTRHGLVTGHLDAVQVLTERVKLTPIKKAR